MARPGQTLHNRASGERITFRATAAQTGGELVAMPPGGRVPGPAQTAVRLADEGRTMFGGIPRPLDRALFLREFEDEVQAAFLQGWLQRAALAPVAWLARRRPLRARSAQVFRSAAL